MTRLTFRPMILACLVAPWLAAAALGTEPPPKGPPWVRELAVAQKNALAKSTPIFIYFTKKS